MDAGLLLRFMGAVAAFNGSGMKPLALLCASPHPELKHFVKMLNTSSNTIILYVELKNRRKKMGGGGERG